MKKVLLALALLGFAGGAMADPADLAGGCFIAHYCEPLGYSSDAPALGWCGEYAASHAITFHDQQVNEIYTTTYLPSSWFVIAAWDGEDKEWCGTEFGFGDYNAQCFGILEWAGCYPPDGGLEIPTAGWPGPNEGIAFVVTGAAWMGNYVPVMWFGGYAYGYYGETVIPIDVDPPTAFAGFSNCAAPPEPFDAVELGGMGINMEGTYAQPMPFQPPTGACCLPGPDYPCEVLTEEECIAAGGEYLGDDTDCGPPNPCLPPGACCLPEPMGECEEMSEENCLLIGGEWLGPETTCEPENPCAGEWVCCYDDGCQCMIVGTQLECEQGLPGGIFHPEWNSCEPNPCEEFTPVDNASWGTIKSMYR
jgi:hypothetical protein